MCLKKKQDMTVYAPVTEATIEALPATASVEQKVESLDRNTKILLQIAKENREGLNEGRGWHEDDIKWRWRAVVLAVFAIIFSGALSGVSILLQLKVI